MSDHIASGAAHALAARSGAAHARRALDAQQPADRAALHLDELVPIVRGRLAIDAAVPDDAVLACLEAIIAHSAPRDRWRAAFDSNLGHWLALKGVDLNSALNTLVSLLPRPRQ